MSSPPAADYRAWMAILRLEPDSLTGLIVADYEVGSSGGILPYLTGLAAAYPLNRWAHLRNRSKRRRLWHYPIKRNWSTPLADGQVQVAFCLSLLDRVWSHWTILTELSRIVETGGRLYLGVSLQSVTNRRGLRKHRLASLVAPFKEGQWRKKYPIRWRWIWWEEVADLPNHRPGRTLLVGCLERIPECAT